MKLRFEPDAIKFRLSDSELSLLIDRQSLSEEIILPQGEVINYQILKSEDIDELEIKVINSSIKAYIPKESVNKLIHSEEIGISQQFHFESDKQLTLVIEKDLPRRKKK